MRLLTSQRTQHAASCELWVKDLEMTRVQDIKDKAKNLGYDVDAKELTEYFNVPPFKIPQPLTPQGRSFRCYVDLLMNHA
jgi:hypothetical protein